MTPNLTGLWIAGGLALACIVIFLWPERCRCKCKRCCKDD